MQEIRSQRVFSFIAIILLIQSHPVLVFGKRMVALNSIHLLKERRQDKVCRTIVTGQHRKQIDDSQFYNAGIVN